MSESTKGEGMKTISGRDIYYNVSEHGRDDELYVLASEAKEEIERLQVMYLEKCDEFHERERLLVGALKAYKEDRCEDPIRERITPTEYKEEWILYDCTKCKSCRVRAALAAKEE